MTERLYYTQPDIMEFTAKVVNVLNEPRPAVILDRTAFYPTSGGQIFDTGTLEANGAKLRVVEVAEQNEDTIAHFVEAPAGITPGTEVRGLIDAQRRRDHMQQHTGQHVLSAVFEELFHMRTVSFHMGDESCTIDLETQAVTPEQLVKAEIRANHVVVENRPVHIRFAPREQAEKMGVRKIPPDITGELRLIDIEGVDLCPCGGTHVARTGQIGPIQVRKAEKVKQGMRVEFVCGFRALRHARRDLETLRAAADVFSAHIWDVPQQIKKAQDDVKAGRKREQKLLEEIAELTAAELLSQSASASHSRRSEGAALTATGMPTRIKQVFPERDVIFIKLLAQKLTKTPGVVALLGSGQPQPSLVFAQSPGGSRDMGAVLKQVLASAGGRGGGSKDLAQGGLPTGASLEDVLGEAEKLL